MTGLLGLVLTPEGFIFDSIAVALPLQIPDLENKEYVHASLLKATYMGNGAISSE